MNSFFERLRAGGTIRFATALALANAPMWVLGHWFLSHRAAVSIDIAVALMVLIVWPSAGVVLLMFAWTADVVLNQSLVFHFATPLELVRSLKFASVLHLGEYFTPSHALLALPFLACWAFVPRLIRNRVNLLLPAGVIVVLLGLVDILNGSSMLERRDQWRLPFNVAGSPIATMTALQVRRERDVPLHTLPLEDTVQGLVDVYDWGVHHPNSSVLFVIVESLGRPTAPAVREWLTGRMSNPSIEERFELRTADIPFRGSTTSGELRSLCGLSGSYREIDEANGRDCLPARMGRLGWTTVGMHGFSGRMFDRRTWWPLIGLQQVNFIDSPLLATAPVCGSLFRGGCDAALLQEGVNALESGRRFVYLLTLNTHLPLVPATVPADLEEICQSSGVDVHTCQLTSALGDVLGQVGSAVGDLSRPPLVVVVGDHAPPFALKASRDDFSADRVPAFVLVPRNVAPRASGS